MGFFFFFGDIYFQYGKIPSFSSFLNDFFILDKNIYLGFCLMIFFKIF